MVLDLIPYLTLLLVCSVRIEVSIPSLVVLTSSLCIGSGCSSFVPFLLVPTGFNGMCPVALIVVAKAVTVGIPFGCTSALYNLDLHFMGWLEGLCDERHDFY